MKAQWKHLIPTTILSALVVVVLISILVWSDRKAKQAGEKEQKNDEQQEQTGEELPGQESEKAPAPDSGDPDASDGNQTANDGQNGDRVTFGASDIRVLLMTTGYESYLHDRVEIYAPYGLRVTTVDCVEEYHGETVLGDSFFGTLPVGESAVIEPILSGTEAVGAGQQTGLTIRSIRRTEGYPAYSGSLSVTRGDRGYYLVNQVPLETYLYSVVPSEMPSSYEQEALCAQAVCARTYAYRFMMNPGLEEYGADVDDSTGFQVYNNIGRTESTDRAVDLTRGKILLYGNVPAETYFYSTSCGISADETVWNMEQESRYVYLTVDRITKLPGESGNGIDYSDEAVFADYIGRVFDDYEKDYPYYRWTYTVTDLDSGDLLKRLNNRYKTNPDTILCHDAGSDSYVSAEPADLGDVTSIRVVERDESGAVRRLCIYGTRASYEVRTCNSIRFVLALPGGILQRGDGVREQCTTMLASAFFCVAQDGGSPGTDNGLQSGYDLILWGGGHGHGVGMSQNAAGAMAGQGMNHEEILTFFYKGTQIGVLQYETSSNDTGVYAGNQKG